MNETTSYIFNNLNIFFDPLYRQSEKNDNVMPIFYEEQPITWLTYKKQLLASLRIKAKVDFLEVGCGCGIWSILFAKEIGGNVLAIDRNPRAVKFTKRNAKLNNVIIHAKTESYNITTTNPKDVKIIYLNPPFHIYPKDLQNKIPLYSRGGMLGQQEFKDQLSVANKHLIDNGVIVFIMMCVGNEEPEYVKYIPKIIDKSSLYYSNILQPISTKEFLSKVYNNNFSYFQKKVVKKYKNLFYTNGIIIKDGKGICEAKDQKLDLHNRNWSDRMTIHKMINNTNKNARS